MDAYVNSVAGYLFAQSWQIALLAVIAGSASLALRNRSAHVRYMLWLIVLAKCLVPPMYSVSIAVLPEKAPVEHARRATFPQTPNEESVAIDVVESVTIAKTPDMSQKQLTLPNVMELTILLWLTGMSLFLLWVGSRAVRYQLWLHRRRMSLPSVLARDEDAISDLMAEAQIAMELAHDNIMRLHYFESRARQKFLLMEYIPGPSLKKLIGQRRRQKQPFTLDEVLPILKQLSVGLDYAHHKGVVHRDIKPANIMLSGDLSPQWNGGPLVSASGESILIKITDFSIARRMREATTLVSGACYDGET